MYTRLAKAAKGNIGLDLSAAQALVGLGQMDAAQAFLDDARKIDRNNYRLHAIQGAIAEADNRYADSSTEYNLAISNLPAKVQEGPLYPIELAIQSV